MNIRPVKIAILVGGVLAALVLGGGAAYASTQSSTPAPARPATHATQQVNTTAGGQDATPGSDKPGSSTDKPESGTGSETHTASDGPGGHADADGANVDHQFNGNE